MKLEFDRLLAIQKNDLFDYVDFAKLVKSQLFQGAFMYALEQYEVHHNANGLSRIASLFYRTNQRGRVNQFIVEKTGLIARAVNGQVTYTRNPLPKKTEPEMETVREIAKRTQATYKPSGRGHDLMDTRMIVPGSYGGGKRR